MQNIYSVQIHWEYSCVINKYTADNKHETGPSKNQQGWIKKQVTKTLEMFQIVEFFSNIDQDGTEANQ